MTKHELLAELGKAVRKIEHPDLTEEEALEKELTVGCMLKSKITPKKTFMINKVANGKCHFSDKFSPMLLDFIPKYFGIEILGLPLTLPRILAALPFRIGSGELKTSVLGKDNKMIVMYIFPSEELKDDIVINLTLRKDGRDCIADNQSEETLEALISVLKTND